jgi:hypothetical protein
MSTEVKMIKLSLLNFHLGVLMTSGKVSTIWVVSTLTGKGRQRYGTFTVSSHKLLYIGDLHSSQYLANCEE